VTRGGGGKQSSGQRGGQNTEDFQLVHPSVDPIHVSSENRLRFGINFHFDSSVYDPI